MCFSNLFATCIFTNNSLLAAVSADKVDLSARPYAITNLKSLLLNCSSLIYLLSYNIVVQRGLHVILITWRIAKILKTAVGQAAVNIIYISEQNNNYNGNW